MTNVSASCSRTISAPRPPSTREPTRLERDRDDVRDDVGLFLAGDERRRASTPRPCSIFDGRRVGVQAGVRRARGPSRLPPSGAVAARALAARTRSRRGRRLRRRAAAAGRGRRLEDGCTARARTSPATTTAPTSERPPELRPSEPEPHVREVPEARRQPERARASTPACSPAAGSTQPGSERSRTISTFAAKTP